jgi:hypothetical protein
MATFAADPKTVTRSHGGANDQAAPALKSLSLGGMISTGGLAGTTATDAKLIHGDRWQQIDGKQTETIDKDLITHIKENETWTVDEDLNLTITGKTTDNRIEDVKEYFHAESRFEYIGEHTDQHHEQDHQLNPTVTFDILHTEGEYKNIDLAIKALVFEAKGAVIDVTVGKAEAWAAGAEAWGASVGAGGFHNEAVALDVGEKVAEQELHGIKSQIHALNSQVAAARTIIMPVRVGICIAIHIDSPWA